MTAPLVTLPTDTLDTYAALLYALTHPESVDGWEDPRTDNPLEARRNVIEEALRDPFMEKQTAFVLLDELSEIITQQGKE